MANENISEDDTPDSLVKVRQTLQDIEEVKSHPNDDFSDYRDLENKINQKFGNSPNVRPGDHIGQEDHGHLRGGSRADVSTPSDERDLPKTHRNLDQEAQTGDEDKPASPPAGGNTGQGVPSSTPPSSPAGNTPANNAAPVVTNDPNTGEKINVDPSFVNTNSRDTKPEQSIPSGVPTPAASHKQGSGQNTSTTPKSSSTGKIEVGDSNYHWLNEQNSVLEAMKKEATNYIDYYDNQDFLKDSSVFTVKTNPYYQSVLAKFQKCHVLAANQVLDIIDQMEGLLASYAQYCSQVQGTDQKTSSALAGLGKRIQSETPVTYGGK